MLPDLSDLVFSLASAGATGVGMFKLLEFNRRWMRRHKHEWEVVEKQTVEEKYNSDLSIEEVVELAETSSFTVPLRELVEYVGNNSKTRVVVHYRCSLCGTEEVKKL